MILHKKIFGKLKHGFDVVLGWVYNPTLSDADKTRLTSEWEEGLKNREKKLLNNLENSRTQAKKYAAHKYFFMLLALLFLSSTILTALLQLPVPDGWGIWAWRGATAAFFMLLICQNLMDGPFIRTFRRAKMAGQTVILIKRGDGKWGWIVDHLRGRAVSSDIYGEYAVVPGSLGMVDNVPVGVADESEGITLPLHLMRIAEDLQIQETSIENLGTLDSIIRVDEKIEEYDVAKHDLEAYIKENENDIPDDDKEKYITSINNYKKTLEYLGAVKTDHAPLIKYQKRTLTLKPFLDFFPTLASNPIFKRTARERAIAIEKAKSGRGENMGKIVVYLSGLMLAAGLTIYLIQSGQVETVKNVAGSAALSTAAAQGIGG